MARHGEVDNPGGILYGRLPRMRLSPEGRRQAEALAGFLAPRPLAAIYTSPMLRARKTAAAIATRHPHLRPRVDSDLHEIKTGWQGRTLAELDFIKWDFYSHRRYPSDEALSDVRDRMRRWVDRMLRRHAGGEVVGVTHGDPILILLGDLRGLPMDLSRIRPRTYIPVASLFRLDFDPTGRFLEAEMFVPHEQAAA